MAHRSAGSNVLVERSWLVLGLAFSLLLSPGCGGCNGDDSGDTDDTGEPDTGAVTCGLSFTDPAGEELLVNGVGFVGDPAADLQFVSAELAVDNAGACQGRTVRVRIGCAPEAADEACTRVYSEVVRGDGVATFDAGAGGGIGFLHGEITTMHGVVESPDGTPSVAGPIDVSVDLVPPTLSIDAPGPSTAVSLDFVAADPQWEQDGTGAVGVVVFTTGGAAGGSYTLRYSDGTALADASGLPLTDMALLVDGTLTVSGVVLPARDEVPGIALEVAVVDAFGNPTTEAVDINVDLDPPPAPTLDVGAPDPRSGAHTSTWSASRDDTGDAASGPVSRYEVRAYAEPAPGDWNDIAVWNAQWLLASVTVPTTSLHVDQLALDARWHVGVRAFDDAGNPSPVDEAEIGTELRRTLLATVSDFTSGRGMTHVGDVDADGYADLLVHRDGEVLLFRGGPDPTSPATVLDTWPGIDTVASSFGSSATPLGDVDGDGVDDFAVGAVFDCAVYLFFGEPATGDPLGEALSTYDVVIEGPGYTGGAGCPDDSYSNLTEIGLSRGGRGNFTDVDPGGGGPAYDDLYFAVYDLGTYGGDVLVVLGRSRADWSALGGSLSVADGCDGGVFTISGTNPPDHPESGLPLPTRSLGHAAGLVDLDLDGYQDLVLSTDYVGSFIGAPPTRGASVQYVFFGDGARESSCGLGDRDLGTTLGAATPDDPDGLFIVDPDAVSVQEIDVRIAVDPGGAGFAVGNHRTDEVAIYREPDAWNDLYGSISVPANLPPPDVWFGRSVWYAGDFDGDPDAAMDLVIGAPLAPASTASHGGLAFVAFGDPPLAGEPSYPTSVATTVEGLDPPWVGTRVSGGLSLAVPDPPREGFGAFVVGGFDHDGDGHPDIAVMDDSDGSIWLYY